MEERVARLEADFRELMTTQATVLREMQESFAAMNARFDQIAQPAPRINEGARVNQRNQPQAPRMKIEFPKFNGVDDPTVWICRAEQFFTYCQTPEEEKVLVASINLEGEAQLWLQVQREGGQELTWEEFKRDMHTRFGPTQFEDFFGDLTKLQQEGTVRDYQTQFEKLLVRAGNLTQAQQAI
ncbi:unnamed protein product [Linum tenue]|uniref:Retrotransposon gag domain-containing protein n=1 Tax=Linum tenue TaxID=586396 RepID=A0AAV0J1M6_9ROSI|nr:unnamed protein product [Linum tenue]